MNRLWAPWRAAYIKKNKQKGCIFCKALKNKNDNKNRVLLRFNHVFVIANAFPYNSGHLMVVPNRHIRDIEELKSRELADLNKAVIRSVTLLKRVLKPHGFNIGMNLGKPSGAGIDGHIHVHIVPRWQGDTNFMPVISGTKIISQSMDDLCKEIKKYL